MPSDKCLQFVVFWLWNKSYEASKLTFVTGFRTLSWHECHGSILILWLFHEPLNAEVSNKEEYLVSELYLMFLRRVVSTPCSYNTVRDYNTILPKPPQLHTHTAHVSHTCTHLRHPIPHFHEWGNNVLLTADSYENIDPVIKRLDMISQ